MSNVIAFPVPIPTAPTVAEEIALILATLAKRPPSADDGFFAAKVAEVQDWIDSATTHDDVSASYFRMGILLAQGIVSGVSYSVPADHPA
jgi:hypothetical protein